MKLGLHTVSVWFGMIMILLVTAGAFAFTFTDFMDDRLYGNKRYIFSGILLAYGIYRGVRLYQTMKYNSGKEE
jgi:hypothetical protein